MEDTFTFNISAQFISINAGFQYGLFFAFYLPTLLTIVLCVVTLLFVKGYHWKLKVLLINIFAAEACTWIGEAVTAFGEPIRPQSLQEYELPCQLAISFYILATVEVFAGVALYGIMVYQYFKYDEKKLKWKIIISCITAAWVTGLILASATFVPVHGVGFCDPKSILSKICLALVLLEMLGCFCVIVFFGVLTYRLFKTHHPQHDMEAKKTLAKSLIYFAIASSATFCFTVIPAATSTLLSTYGRKSILAYIMIVHVLNLAAKVPPMLNPLATIIILKPIRSGICYGVKFILCCGYCRKATPPIQAAFLQEDIKEDSL